MNIEPVFLLICGLNSNFMMPLVQISNLEFQIQNIRDFYLLENVLIDFEKIVEERHISQNWYQRVLTEMSQNCQVSFFKNRCSDTEMTLGRGE